MYYERISKNVRKYRLLRGLTQDELARLSDMSRAFISNIEAGRAGLNIDRLLRLCHALGVSPNDLIWID